MGGKGFNQAVATALATGGGNRKGKVSFYGTVGDDEAGKGLKEKLLSMWGLRNDTLFLDPVCRWFPSQGAVVEIDGRIIGKGDWKSNHSGCG
jgi:sugar/nucleoside kinase (ribokinase family)